MNKQSRVAALLVRLTLGVCFCIHGGPKVVGLFDGTSGIVGTMKNLGFEPAFLFGSLVAFGELLGGIAMIFGVFTRAAGIGLALIMVGAIWTVHGKNGYHVTKEGFEYNLALMVMAISVALTGPGAYAFKIKKADS